MPMDEPVTAAPVAPVAPVAAPRWMRIALVVSLALNLLIAGAAIGMVLRGGPPPVAVRDLGFGPFAAALSPEDRAALRRDWLARTAAQGDGRRGMREDMRALLATLRAEPFDPEALRAILSRGAARTAGRLDLGLSLIEGRVTALSQAERMDFADRLEHEFRRGPRKRGTRRDDGPAP